MQCSLCLTCILDQGQVTKYFCRMSLVMYLVYYNYSNAGPECQANHALYIRQFCRATDRCLKPVLKKGESACNTHNYKS